jgi:hypothetical protein
MTTVVEPERPPRRRPGKRLVLVICGTILAIALIIIGACSIGGGDFSPQDNPTDPGQNTGPYIAEASFVLQNCATLSTEAQQFWRDLTLDQVIAAGLPFSRYNRYYTRFFLKEGEVVELRMEASVPLGADLTELTEGISVMLIPGNAPYGHDSARDYIPATETGNGGYFQDLSRAGGNWQIAWAIAALNSDYYWLILTNTARQDAWCHLTVSVPSG